MSITQALLIFFIFQPFNWRVENFSHNFWWFGQSVICSNDPNATMKAERELKSNYFAVALFFTFSKQKNPTTFIWLFPMLLLLLHAPQLLLLFPISVTRLGDLLDFGQVFKAFGNNIFAQISHILRHFL